VNIDAAGKDDHSGGVDGLAALDRRDDFAIDDLPGRGCKPTFSPSGSSVDPCHGV